MSALQCDICGGSLTMDAGGEFASCETYGMKYDKRRMQQKVQKIKGTVKIEGAVEIQNVANVENKLCKAREFFENADRGCFGSHCVL